MGYEIDIEKDNDSDILVSVVEDEGHFDFMSYDYHRIDVVNEGAAVSPQVKYFLEHANSLTDLYFGASKIWNVLPHASATVLGGIKVGSNLTIDINGVLNGAPGTGGGIWSEIGGDISTQVDLMTMFALYATLASPVFTSQIVTPLIYGSVVANGDITIEATSHATRATSYLLMQQAGGAVCIGASSPTNNRMLTVGSNGVFSGIYSAGNIEMPLGKSLFIGGTSDSGQRFKFTTNTGTGDGYLDYYDTLHLRSGATSSGDRIIFKSTGEMQLLTGGLHIGGSSDAGDNNLLVDGATTLGGDVSSITFFSGFAGSGWKLDEATGKYNLTIDNLTVRESLTAYALDINKINSINGGIIISSANGTALTVSGTTIYFDEDGSSKLIQFVVDDYIRAQIWTGRGIASYVGKITSIHHDTTYGAAYIVATTISGTPWNGMELVQIGNSSDTARQNLLYLTASDTNNPYIDMLSGVDAGSFTNKQKLRIGNLVGITDASFGGALTGYGLYANNIYLKGQIIISNPEDIDQTSLTNAAAANAQVNTINAGDGLNALDSAASSKLTGIAAGATVGATWGTNLYSIPGTLGTPTGSGLFLSSTYMGFYTASAWKTFIKNDGTFAFAGDANNYVTWNGTVLAIKGNITATAGLIGGFTISPTEGLYSGSGITHVHMKPGVGFWAGADLQVNAPFSVTQAGQLRVSVIGDTIGNEALYFSSSNSTIYTGAAGWNLDVKGTLIAEGLLTATGVHVGGTSSPGTDNLLVDGTTTLTGGIYGNLSITGAFGCNGATPQTSYSSPLSLSYTVGTNGFGTTAQLSNLMNTVSVIRSALVNNGIMSY